MAYREPRQAIETGVTVDPRDVMVNFNELAREINGHIDRDNVTTGAISSTKLGTQEMTYAFDNPVEGAPLHTIAAGSTGEWQDITSMSKTVTLPGGSLVVDTDVNFEWGGAGASIRNQKVQFRTLVNGNQIAETGPSHISRGRTTLSMTGSVPIVTGSTTVSVQGRAWTDPWYHVNDVNNGRNKSVTQAYNLNYTFNSVAVSAGNIVGVVQVR